MARGVLLRACQEAAESACTLAFSAIIDRWLMAAELQYAEAAAGWMAGQAIDGQTLDATGAI